MYIKCIRVDVERFMYYNLGCFVSLSVVAVFSLRVGV